MQIELGKAVRHGSPSPARGGWEPAAPFPHPKRAVRVDRFVTTCLLKRIQPTEIWMTTLALALHILGAVVWVGGMFAIYMCLRPALGTLEPPQRLRLMRVTFQKF